MFVAAAVLGLVTLHGHMTPVILLCLTALMGLGNALSGPVFQAIIYEVVPAARLSSAITLNSASFNLARAVGPAIGGFLVAAAGIGATFLATAATFLGVMGVLYRWKRPPPPGAMPRKRLVSAMHAGVQHVWAQDRLRSVLIRVGAFTIGASAFWALLPLVARLELKATPMHYGVLFACFGMGAVGVTALLPSARRQLSEEALVQSAALIFAVSLLVLGTTRSLIVANGAMLFAGAMWLLILTTFNMAIHIGAEEWVRGRALAIYFMVLFGAMAGGSALWGVVAEAVGVSTALQIAAGTIALTSLIGRRYRLNGVREPNLTSASLTASPWRSSPAQRSRLS
jgi:MFS family permease